MDTHKLDKVYLGIKNLSITIYLMFIVYSGPRKGKKTTCCMCYVKLPLPLHVCGIERGLFVGFTCIYFDFHSPPGRTSSGIIRCEKTI